ncbi:uncharacterized protein METZ01_LOCUS369597, partial [marine metagenome]
MPSPAPIEPTESVEVIFILMVELSKPSISPIFAAILNASAASLGLWAMIVASTCSTNQPSKSALRADSAINFV